MSAGADAFRSVVSDLREGKELTPLEIEERLNRANALVYLLSSTLMNELRMSDSHKDRMESTTCGINALEMAMRDDLSSMIG